MKWLVSVREVHVQGQIVEADTKEEAIEKVAAGDGDIIGDLFEYSHTLDPETWTAEELQTCAMRGKTCRDHGSAVHVFKEPV